jgi:hypothetical protein
VIEPRHFRKMQALILLLILALAWAGKKPDYWPIVTWPVYHKSKPKVPGSTHKAVEVLARTREGTAHVLRRGDLVEWSRHRIADQAIARAVESEDARVYLAALVRRALGEEVASIELWEIRWTVDIAAVPPFDRNDPASRRKLADFRVEPEAPR